MFFDPAMFLISVNVAEIWRKLLVLSVIMVQWIKLKKVN